MRVFAATDLFPVSSAPLRDGAVAVDGGRIVACGPRAAVLEQAGGDAELHDLGRAALLPGLVNAHCHVELSWMEPSDPPDGGYVDWVRELIARRAAVTEAEAARAASEAIELMVARGTVAVGDIANELWVAPLLRASTLRGVLFHELLGPRASIEETEAAEGWRVVPTPHAPHTVPAPLLRALAERAAQRNEPLSIHVAESREELALLANGSGAFAELFDARDFWSDGWRPPGKTPVAYLDELGLLSPRTLVVHAVQLTADDRATLRARGAHVVTCPRSNEHLGVGRAPVPELLAEGVPVALGTDSLASSPDLDLFGEMAALARIHPALAPETVLRIATLNGATALGLANELGSLERGKRAELIAVPLDEGDDDPLRTLCSVPEEVRRL